jgi:2-oxoglutarate dehydrogenase E1 component
MAPPSDLPTSLLTGENAPYIDRIYTNWVRDPTAVPPEWSALFAGLDAPAPNGGPTPGVVPQFPHLSLFTGSAGSSAPTPDPATVMAAARRQTGVAQLINAYRVRGHKQSQIDPLGTQEVAPHPELDPAFYGLSKADLDVPVSGRPLYGVPEITTPRHILSRLRKAYCGGFGAEFMNIGDIEKKRWLQRRVETLQDSDVLDRNQELHALRLLADAENFERLLHTRFPGTKRFSVEGAETVVPLLDFLIEAAAELGVDEAILGMAHRGRLNILANILKKPVRLIFDEFEGTAQTFGGGSGDVKYHLGYSSVLTTNKGHEILMSLAFNPSHLEAVDPVVEGRSRARQDRRGGEARHNVLPVLVHGDAAFAGQGVVAETLNLSELAGYRTGGTIHIIINNQIGFTTSPADARSTDYCTDVARMLQVPIFHVNGEDVEAVAAVSRLAAEWRQTYHQDVIIDMYCFRKHGHNEGDEPSFTQPLLYEKIRTHPNPRVVYARKMVDERGDLTRAEADQIVGDSRARLEQLMREEGGYHVDSLVRANVEELWQGYRGKLSDPVDTTFPRDQLVALLRTANQVPSTFHAHRKIVRLLRQRLDIIEQDRPVDWAIAEQAAYATLVTQGTAVRLSGQDSGRGTFSHRHAVLTDIVTGAEHIPLAHVAPDQRAFRVYDSLLSEAAVLGFEYGYTLEAPDTLVLWEAQFGDFANGAQVIFDNFISSGEQKWDRMSGLVMLLPHGYEGQGPEHSSARLERYLQCCAEENMVVANCTTPASFFHLLRRQALQRVRKPLIVMAPKSLLRHPECQSTLDELANGSFRPVFHESDDDVSLAGARRVVFCTGKIYYELRAARRERGITDVPIIRLERLYPFPSEEVQAVVAQCPQGVGVTWCQEEPRNMGAWPMVDEWMGEALGGRTPRYSGRPAAAATATGYPSKHRAEQDALIDDALGRDKEDSGNV